MLRQYLSQPKSFTLIFFLELWERFGYYGVQVLLVVFMVRHLQVSDKSADYMVSAFSALVFLLPCAGGYVGDHWLGTKRCIVIGACILALGYGLMMIHRVVYHHLYWALAVVAVGNGLFKANPSSLLAKVYDDNTQYHPDSGFTMYYMAINVGAFASMSLTPWLSHRFGYVAGFAACFLGLLIALINYALMRGRIKQQGSAPDFQALVWRRLILVLLACVALVLLCAQLLQHHDIASMVLLMGSLIYLSFYFYFIKQAKPHEKKPMLLFAILFLQGVVFFVLYIQMQTSLTLFALRNVQHHIGPLPLEPESFQAINPFWIMILSPCLAVLYQRQRKNKADVSVLSKFALGIILAGSAFLLLTVATRYFATAGMVSGTWLLGSYGLQSLGELLVSALGFSLAARYVPKHLMGFAMGIWLLSTSVASMLGGQLAAMASIPSGMTDPVKSLAIYSHLFLMLGSVTVVIGIICLLLVPLLKRLEPCDTGDDQVSADCDGEWVQDQA